jgi:hypothetical protein
VAVVPASATEVGMTVTSKNTEEDRTTTLGMLQIQMKAPKATPKMDRVTIRIWATSKMIKTALTGNRTRTRTNPGGTGENRTLLILPMHL